MIHMQYNITKLTVNIINYSTENTAEQKEFNPKIRLRMFSPHFEVFVFSVRFDSVSVYNCNPIVLFWAGHWDAQIKLFPSLDTLQYLYTFVSLKLNPKDIPFSFFSSVEKLIRGNCFCRICSRGVHCSLFTSSSDRPNRVNTAQRSRSRSLNRLFFVQFHCFFFFYFLISFFHQNSLHTNKLMCTAQWSHASQTHSSAEWWTNSFEKYPFSFIVNEWNVQDSEDPLHFACNSICRRVQIANPKRADINRSFRFF